jgi:hypothetical protein
VGVDAAQDTSAVSAKLGNAGRVAQADDLIRNAELSQRSNRVASQVEGEAKLARVVGALEDPRAPAAVPERDAGGKASDARPDDERGAHDAITAGCSSTRHGV